MKYAQLPTAGIIYLSVPRAGAILRLRIGSVSKSQEILFPDRQALGHHARHQVRKSVTSLSDWVACDCPSKRAHFVIFDGPFSPPLRSMIFWNASSGGRCFGFGFIINNANGLIENVIGKIVDGFPNRFVNGGCANSICSLFTKKPQQTVSENLVSPGYLQRQVGNSLEGVSVRTPGPFNVLVQYRFVFRHFKEAAVFCFLPRSLLRTWTRSCISPRASCA